MVGFYFPSRIVKVTIKDVTTVWLEAIRCLRNSSTYSSNIIGERKFRISPKLSRDDETYNDYMARVEKQGFDADRTSGNHWTEGELEALARAIETGVTQLEGAAALPHRSWEAIRKKTSQTHGKGI